MVRATNHRFEGAIARDHVTASLIYVVERVEVINFEDSKTLIDDGGEVTPQLQKHDKSRVDLWKLSDFIEDMKSWPDVGDKVKKYGYRKTAHVLNNHYQGLAIWLEYYLLHRKELHNQLFSNDSLLIYLKPHADLSAASHSFIDKHFYPRAKWLWESLAPNSDVLWGLFEYSWCYSSFKKIIEGTNAKSKSKMLVKLSEAINTKCIWLEEVDGVCQKLSAGIIESQTFNENKKQETLKRFQHIREFLQKAKGNPLANIHKLVILQSELLIFRGEHSLIKPYNLYLQERQIYRKAVKGSEQLQVLYLPSPDDDPVYSEKGQKIQHSKGVEEKRGRGRPPKSQ